MRVRRPGWPAFVMAGAAVEGVLIRLGRTYGATAAERRARLPGDDLIAHPGVQTDHAVTIDVPVNAVWPWLVQMGWGRGGWYTARWVDRLFFPANGPSAERIDPELQDIEVGSFIPDGPPETRCGFSVERLRAERFLVLRSNSHLPVRWRRRAAVDWTWAFLLTPSEDGRRTRFHFRSRWSCRPWWLTVASWGAVVPADFVMSRDMLRGVKSRAEAWHPTHDVADGVPVAMAEEGRIDLSEVAAESPAESIAHENELVEELALEDDGYVEQPCEVSVAEELEGLVDPDEIRRLG